MPVYMVERELKGIPMGDLAAAQQLAIQKATDYTARGTPMRYIRSTFALEDGRCMCLFEAEKADHVRQLNDEAQIPYTRWRHLTSRREAALLTRNFLTYGAWVSPAFNPRRVPIISEG